MKCLAIAWCLQSQNMIDPAVFICEPLDFNNKFKIYPPKVKEVVTNPHFAQFMRVLTISQEDIQDELPKKDNEDKAQTPPTPFEFLLINCYHSKQFLEIAKKAFQFFLHDEVNFFYEQKKLIIGNLEKVVTEIDSVDDLITISEEEYFDFQNVIRRVCGDSPIKPPEPPNLDEDPRITEMKAKARRRDRIKAKQKNSGGISLTTCLVAICCMGIGITPLNIGEMSYATIGPIMKMSQEKEKYDIDIRSLLAGADSKKIKPKYWIRNSEKE